MAARVSLFAAIAEEILGGSMADIGITWPPSSTGTVEQLARCGWIDTSVFTAHWDQSQPGCTTAVGVTSANPMFTAAPTAAPIAAPTVTSSHLILAKVDA